MEKKPKKRVSVLAIAFVLVIGTIVPGMIVFGRSESFEEGDVVVLAIADNDEEVKELSEYGEILDHYGRNVLIQTTERGEEELKAEHETRSLDHRNELRVKGHEIDTNEGLPEINDDLKIDDYLPGTEGIYLVDLIGPVNPEWREKLEEKGVDIINYVPNYAYEVKMTPELAEDVEDLFFVDWVGVYQPEFKLDQDLEPGLVTIQMADGSREIREIEDESTFVEIAQRIEVYYISNYKEPELHDEISSQTIGGGHWIMDPDDDPYVPWRGHDNEYEYGAHANHLGYSGEGLVSVVADSGIHETHEDFQGRVIGGHYWGTGDDYTDGDGHGTHVAGSIAGDTYRGTETLVQDLHGDIEIEDYYAAQGLAYESELYSARIFDDDGNWVGPGDYSEIVTLPRDEIGPDAYIHANSWGADTEGSYGNRDSDYDSVVRDAGDGEPMIITVSAGNEGEDDDGDPVYQSTGSPGNAKNVITVGASETFYPGLSGYAENYEADPDRTASFSSRGWTEDGRVKPDVMAPGMWVYSTGNEADDDYYATGGTSMSNPAVAGAAGVIVEWYEEEYGVRPSPAMVKALMINTAYDMEDQEGDFYTGPIPNRDEGWGMVNLPMVMDAPVDFMLEDQTSVLETGQMEEYEIQYQDSNEPLKISTVWTDAAASSGTEHALINDLNLEVETPSGDIIRGNAFDQSGDGESDDGFTYPDAEILNAFDGSGDGWDDRNNVQNVYIHQDELESGNYTVRVIGENIGDPVVDDGQDYALTIYNAVPEGEEPPEPTENLEVQHADLTEEWHWMYDDEHRAEPDSGIGVESPGPWYGAMRTELPAGEITDIAYHDLEEAHSVQGYIYEDLGTEPGELLGETYEITNLGYDEWRELPLKTSIEIDADHYWVALEIDDIGEDHYPFGVMEPYQEDSGWISYDGDDWTPLEDEGLDYSWALEVMVRETDENDNRITWDASPDDPESVSHYNIYRSEDEGGPWDDSTSIREVEADGSNEYEYIDREKGMADNTFWWYVVRAVDESVEEDNEDSVREPIRPFQVEISDYAEEAVKDEEYSIQYNITNIGTSEATQDVVFTVDEEIIGTEEVKLEEGDKYQGEFTWIPEDLGVYTLKISSDDHRVEVTIPVVEDANFEVRIRNYDREVIEGDTVVVEYEVENTGETEDNQRIEFMIEHELIDQEEVTLSGGDIHDSEFIWQTDEGDAGVYELLVTSEDDEDDARITVYEPDIFAVEMRPWDREFVEGEEVGVNYTIWNTKETEDTQTIDFKVYRIMSRNEDELIYSSDEDLTLPAGETEEGTFTWQTDEDEAGRYSINVSSEEDYEETFIELIPKDVFHIDVRLFDRDFVEQEDIFVNYTVTSTKDEEAAQDIVFTISNHEDEPLYQDVNEGLTLEPGESEEGEFIWKAEDTQTGNYVIKVASEEDNETSRISVWKADSFSVIIDLPERHRNEILREGRQISIDYSIKNTKEDIDTQDIRFYIDDELIETKEEVKLEPGEKREREQFEWTTEQPYGERTLNVESDDDSDEVMIEIGENAYFEVKINEPEEGQEFEEGEQVVVNYTVTNTGDVTEKQNINFFINGERIDEREVQLESEESVSGEFLWQGEESGDYDLRVESRNDHETVTINVGEEIEDEGLVIPGFTLMTLMTILIPITGIIIAIYIVKKFYFG